MGDPFRDKNKTFILFSSQNKDYVIKTFIKFYIFGSLGQKENR